eukprot:scaffold1525_cov142-Cylindrotheca_fusiformis.AAC.134
MSRGTIVRLRSVEVEHKVQQMDTIEAKRLIFSPRSTMGASFSARRTKIRSKAATANSASPIQSSRVWSINVNAEIN